MSAGKALIAALLLASALAFLRLRSGPKESVFEPAIKQVESQSPCAWNDAETDFGKWFPGATGYAVQDVILSGKRIALQEQIGRPLLPEEMLLHTYVVRSNETAIGTVLTRRFKGEHGAIEFVIGLDADRKIRHLKIQRIREPAEVIDALAQRGLEASFQNKSVDDELIVEPRQAAGPAKELAMKIAGEVKTVLVLYNAGCDEIHRGHH